MSTDDTQGERIAKVLARAGLASRRDAEILIAEGRVAVNGTVIDSPALNVTAADRITVDGKPLPEAEPPRLWLYHKPAGLVTTARDELGRDTVFDALPPDLPRVMTVGRLDLTSEGLLLLTNDGEIKRRLELPSTGWLRRYRVRVNGTPDELRLSPLREGITIDGELFAPMTITLDRQQGANAWLTIGIREGRNREIRRAMEAVGLVVNRLIRIGYGPFQLGDLPPGAVEEVRPRVVRDQLGLAETPAPAPSAAPGAPAPAAGRARRGPQATPVAGGRTVAVLRTPPNTLGRPRPVRGPKVSSDDDTARPARVGRMDPPGSAPRAATRGKAGATDRPARGGGGGRGDTAPKRPDRTGGPRGRAAQGPQTVTDDRATAGGGGDDRRPAGRGAAGAPAPRPPRDPGAPRFGGADRKGPRPPRGDDDGARPRKPGTGPRRDGDRTAGRPDHDQAGPRQKREAPAERPRDATGGAGRRPGASASGGGAARGRDAADRPFRKDGGAAQAGRARAARGESHGSGRDERQDRPGPGGAGGTPAPRWSKGPSDRQRGGPSTGEPGHRGRDAGRDADNAPRRGPPKGPAKGPAQGPGGPGRGPRGGGPGSAGPGSGPGGRNGGRSGGAPGGGRPGGRPRDRRD